MELIGDLKLYEWGKFGESSKVAQLQLLNDDKFKPANSQTYAELWMGDHLSGPSKLKSSGVDFSTILDKNKQEYLGGMEKLPFLLKVLSINKALSIQVHPNKEEAGKLHMNRPDLYKDPNHKPELAIALTPFLALCGFRPYDEIYELMQTYPELIDLIGRENVQSLLTENSEGLKKCFHKLMTSSDENLIKCINSLEEKFKKNTDLKDKLLKSIFHTINRDFPNDVGILCLFFLNIIELKPGEAIFLQANEIHAYLDGDCIECMACSDNVVRAGLTPKLKDVDTLIKMLNYDASPAEEKLFKPIDCSYLEYTQHFVPIVKDFAVAKIEVPKSENLCQIENRTFGSILIVLTGEATIKITETIHLKPGSIVFVPSNADKFINLDIKKTNSDFLAYQAMYNNF